MSNFISSALWGWFWSWPWYAHIALAAGVVLFLWGALAGLYSFASKIGGWKAGLGALLAVGGLLAALWPRRKGVTTEQQYGNRDPVAAKPTKRRPTIPIFNPFRRK